MMRRVITIIWYDLLTIWNFYHLKKWNENEYMHIRSRADCSDRTDLRLRPGRDPCVLCVCRVLCLVCAVSVPPCRLCHVFGRKEDGKGGEYSKPISLYGPVSSPTPPCLRWKIFGRLIIHLESLPPSPRPSVEDPEVISHQSLI